MNRKDMIRCMRDGCTYQQLHTILDYIDDLKKENQQLKILIENLELGVTLNEEQEKLLDSILFGSDKND